MKEETWLSSLWYCRPKHNAWYIVGAHWIFVTWMVKWNSSWGIASSAQAPSIMVSPPPLQKSQLCSPASWQKNRYPKVTQLIGDGVSSFPPSCPLSISCLLVWALSAKLRLFLVPSISVPKKVPLSISQGECCSNPTKLQWAIVIFLHRIHQETSPGIYLAASDRYLVAMFFPLTISSK